MVTETIKSIIPTITTIFLLPILKIPRESLIDNKFINAYSRDGINERYYEDAIYLLFKPSNIDKFREFLDGEYERDSHILEDYDIPGDFIMVVYKLDDKYSSDYTLVREGRYSQTSEAFQKEFPKIKKIIINGLHRDELSTQFKVFRKTRDLVEFWEEKFGMNFSEEQEVWTKFNIDNETLTEDKLREYE
jgi:hypothetical protein